MFMVAKMIRVKNLGELNSSLDPTWASESSKGDRRVGMEREFVNLRSESTLLGACPEAA